MESVDTTTLGDPENKGTISLIPLCQCLSEETLKAVGPFYLVSMPGEGKDPMQTVTGNLSWT